MRVKKKKASTPPPRSKLGSAQKRDTWKRRFTLRQVSDRLGVAQPILVEFIEREWILPAAPSQWDAEDIARAHLIRDLLEEMGVNEESVPIILQLLDHVHGLRRELLLRLRRAA